MLYAFVDSVSMMWSWTGEGIVAVQRCRVNDNMCHGWEGRLMDFFLFFFYSGYASSFSFGWVLERIIFYIECDLNATSSEIVGHHYKFFIFHVRLCTWSQHHKYFSIFLAQEEAILSNGYLWSVTQELCYLLCSPHLVRISRVIVLRCWWS